MATGKGVQGWGGGWSDSFVAHETELYPVPDDLSDDQAVMIEPFSVGVRAALRKLPKAGERALIIGTGIVGLNVLQAVRALSPESKIACVTRYKHQADLAKELGADEIIGRDDQNEAVARITQAKLYKGPLNNVTLLGGYDVIYDCVGSAQTLKSSLRWAKAGGTVEIVGIDMYPLTLDLSPIWHQEVDLIGIYTHGSEVVNGTPHHTYETVIDLIRQKKLKTEGLITHRFPLSQWKEAVKTAMDKKTGSIKVVLACGK
jgi:threonine dehydrogenase-like Zn-dependent dehydrogenase